MVRPQSLADLVAARGRRRQERNRQRVARELLLGVVREELPSGLPIFLVSAAGATWLIVHPSLDELDVRLAAVCGALLLEQEPQLRMKARGERAEGRTLTWSTLREVRDGIARRPRPTEYVDRYFLGLEERSAV